MSIVDVSKTKFKAVSKVEKYEEGVTQEQIDSGLVEPIETIMSEGFLELTQEEAEKLGYIAPQITEGKGE